MTIHSDGPTPAGAPFDHPDADVILRSSDNTDFRLFRVVLSLASPFFATLFTLPRIVNDNSVDQDKELPVIPVTEDKDTLDRVLRLCYPGHTALLKNLDDVKSLLEAVRKYEMDVVMPYVKASLVSPKNLQDNPLRVFVIAYLNQLRDEAGLAAKATLRLQRRELWCQRSWPEFRLISVAAYSSLLRYHEWCGDAAALITTLSGESRDIWAEFAVTQGDFYCFTTASPNCSCRREPLELREEYRYVAQWWLDFITEVKRIVQDRPCGEVAVSLSLEKRFIAVAAECCHCRKNAAHDLHAFSLILSQKIAEAVDVIPFEQNFEET